MKFKLRQILVIILFLQLTNPLIAHHFQDFDLLKESIPTAGNAWVYEKDHYIDSDIVTQDGIRHWSKKSQKIHTFFYSEKAGKITLSMIGKVQSGKSMLKITIGSDFKKVSFSSSKLIEVSIGEFNLPNGGYHNIEIEALDKEGNTIADIDQFILIPEKGNGIRYVKDDFYFGRRGPSVHLRFKPPESIKNVEWFYSEILIPKGEDVIGSYFMANGFGEGYFGIQVNSETERRILFSIWSPFKTDKPSEVPEDYKIRLLKKGTGVTTGEFGDEGSGGQSYKIFNWKYDITYGFLVGAKPDNKNNTIYTAYFFDPETQKWQLIAQFKRPKTSTYLTRLYSFLENFIPFQGVFARKGLFGNQWIYGNNQWVEITNTEFTADATARKEYRLDYSGGVQGNMFYLKNCGFTDDQVTMKSTFKRQSVNKKPRIDFQTLE